MRSETPASALVSEARPHVVVLTPLGQGGRGGIDRLMDEIRSALPSRDAQSIDVRFLTTRGNGRIIWSPLFMLQAALTLIWLKVSRRADVVHINVSSDGSTYRKLSLSYVVRALRIPYVVHLHSGSYREFWDRASKPLSRAIDGLFAHSTRVIVLGSIWKKYVDEKCPAVNSRTVIVPNATRAAASMKPQKSADAPLGILYLGKLAGHKGTPELVSALSRVADLKNWSAVLAGNGEVDETREQVAKLGLSERVSLPGWVDDDAVQTYLQSSDILVLPSYYENLPMSVIEAFAHGVTVITTPVGGIPDIVQHENTGLLVPPGDVDALTEALRRLLTDSNLRDRLGAKGKALHTEKLEINAYVRQLFAIWQAASARTPR
jgi:glycosyltransferase involved in cell wall biosynthesis